MTKPIPQGFHAVTPYVVFKDSRKAIDFYKKAFGARETFAMERPDKKGIMHATISIGDSTMMMGDETQGEMCRSAATIGDSPVSFYLYVEDVDAAFKKAVAAGAKPVQGVSDMFYGDRIGAVKDPFGHSWTLATHTRDLSREEVEKGAKEFYARAAHA